DLLGTRALVEPYMGYLHTLPRLIAWVAGHLLDPAWWPRFYNGVSFAICLAVLAPFFTPRFVLPANACIGLALVHLPPTHQVFYNVTNLQWPTGFGLLQQVLTAPPRTRWQGARGLMILAIVALTGPFGILFVPLFAWRWWQRRDVDNTLALAVIVLCAAIQA